MRSDALIEILTAFNHRKCGMPLRPFDQHILNRLVQKGMLKEEQIPLLFEESQNSGKTIQELLITRCMSEQQLIAFLSEELECTPVNPGVFSISEEVIKKIPASFAYQYRTVPISEHGNVLTVAMENPCNLEAVDDLRVICNMRIKPAFALSHHLVSVLQKYYPQSDRQRFSDKKEETIEELVRIVQETKAQETEIEAHDLLKQAQETPVVKIANLLLVDAIKRKASDLFIEPWEKILRVRCRVDGLLEEMQSPPKAMSAALVSRFKVMSQLDIAERRMPQDGRFKIKVQSREVDIRVSVLPTCYGEKVCLRVLDKKTQMQSLAQLGFTSKALASLKNCVLKPHGMILVTGPTGSGKTTTLYSVLKFLDSPEKNITTVEDPVEYQASGINQVNVRDSIGLTFPTALRSILRQDPDIILIGEIRDLVTMDIAIKAALTGHLVLSTLHTNDTTSAVIRILNMGVEPFLITSSVLLISAQRLVRHLCQECRMVFHPDAEILKRLDLGPNKKPTFFRPAGCSKCRMTGYSGRTVISEVLMMTSKIRALIMKTTKAEEIKQAARQEGMTTLRQSGIEKALNGETSLDEVFRVTAGDQEIQLEAE